jgi:hypothetical protein
MKLNNPDPFENRIPTTLEIKVDEFLKGKHKHSISPEDTIADNQTLTRESLIPFIREICSEHQVLIKKQREALEEIIVEAELESLKNNSIVSKIEKIARRALK